ncbi:MAG: hypothetical protein J6B96_07030 [Agathobacter sp.]|nr:hypothetical protein [Agathobacter sp.]
MKQKFIKVCFALFLSTLIIFTYTPFSSYAAESSVSTETSTAGAETSKTETSTTEQDTSASEEPLNIIILRSTEKELEISIPNLKTNCLVSKENLKVIGKFQDSYGEFIHTWEIKTVRQTGENQFLLTGINKQIKNFAYTVSLDTLEEASEPLVSDTRFTLEENTADSSQNTEKKSKRVIVRNQEAIRITDTATLPDGSLPQNMHDVAAMAFSFMTEDGIPVVPTYEGNATGVAEITSVKYRTIKSANTVIVQSIVLKVYLDTNDDGWVSKEEKTVNALGYYCIEVNVDKTLKVDDWSIVVP